MTRIRPILLAISVAGTLLFSGAFVVALVRPIAIESLGRMLIQRRIETTLERFAITKALREVELSKRIASISAEMLDSDCSCRRFIGKALHSGSLLLTNRLTGLIRARYRETAASLVREFRIFTAANALVFVLLLGTVYARRDAGFALLVPATILVGAATIVASLYLFAQNWLHTIVFSDYVGLGYFAYLGLAIAFLADVIVNQGRISTVVVQVSCDLAGGVISAVC